MARSKDAVLLIVRQTFKLYLPIVPLVIFSSNAKFASIDFEPQYMNGATVH
jgi:hypothetical protein